MALKLSLFCFVSTLYTAKQIKTSVLPVITLRFLHKARQILKHREPVQVTVPWLVMKVNEALHVTAHVTDDLFLDT